ncbi:MAG: PSD1 and planctomycete cytochrome C domain-containing protein [Bryobacteraceae bacterium]
MRRTGFDPRLLAWPILAAFPLFGAGYESALAPIFRTDCLPCHSGPSPQAGLDLSTLESALKGGKTGPALKLGSAESSLLVAKIVSGQMPPGRKLKDAQVSAIRSWIDEQKTVLAGVTEADVTPIFQMRCVVCHGKRTQEAGLDLRTQEGRLKGGKSGPAVAPGRPEDSLILKKVIAGVMPPPKLLMEAFVRPPSSEEVETLRAWIAAGCPPTPPQPVMEERFTDAERAWWAFQPPRLPAEPQVRNTALVRNPIDRFLLANLETKGLAFSKEADRLVLMRRVYLTLTGLIPTAKEIDEFLRDERSNAYELLVDRLLDSPQYGERWARIWLDAAGYADSEGIKEEDRLRPNAWRYRDAVIRSLNADKPYDRFVTEQIAGDELADYRKLRAPAQEDIDRVASTGFLRMAPDATYSPSNGSVAERMNVIADEIEVLSSTLMGLTVGCARCHNHKYDPIPQRDYYRLGAVLQAAFDPYDWVKTTERDLDLALPEERKTVHAHNEPLNAEVKKLEQAIEDRAKPWRDKTGKKSLDELAKQVPEFKTELDRLRRLIADVKSRLLPEPRVRALYDMGGALSPVFLLKRGEAQQLGEVVEPNTPSILKGPALKPYSVEPPYEGTSGRRLALARWLTQPDHPLTARVMVNRLWKQHFGRGIVSTVANFGKTGAPPSHPELLDWLAVEFVRSDWSLKAMHRLMVTSAAYRQSSTTQPEALSADPENVLLSRMSLRRMDAEQLHDSILLAAGRLSLKQFGPPVPVETEAAGEVVERGSKDEWRRAIYLLQRRSMPVTLLEVFDLPPMSPNCTDRAHSTVPNQALELRNSPLVLEHARYLAGRLLDEFPDSPSRVEAAYIRTLSRKPARDEMDRALAMLERLTSQWEAHLRSQRTTAPYAMTAVWRALGDLAHALLISAEFSYVD